MAVDSGQFTFVPIRELSDVQLANFWKLVCSLPGGVDRSEAFFADRHHYYAGDFAKWCRCKDNYIWIVLYRGKVQALCALNGVKGRTAWGHFLFLPCGRIRVGKHPLQVALTREILNYWLHLKDPDDNFILDRVLGLTPSDNKAAWHLVKAWGGRHVATLPGGCYVYKRKENVDGLVSETTREDLF